MPERQIWKKRVVVGMHRLDPYAFWRIEKHTDLRWQYGEPTEDVFECSVRMGHDKLDTHYAETIQDAVTKALASPNKKRFVLR